MTKNEQILTKQDIVNVVQKYMWSKNTPEVLLEMNLSLQNLLRHKTPTNPNEVLIKANSNSLIEADNLFTLVVIGGYDLAPSELLPRYGYYESKNAFYEFLENGYHAVTGKTIQDKREEKLDELLD